MVTPQNANCPVCSKTFAAKDASIENINPEEIKAAVEKVKTAIDTASSNIAKTLEPIASDAEKAYILDKTRTIAGSMEKAYEKANEEFNTFKNKIESAELYNKAVTKHDEFQNQYNEEAKQAAAACAASHDNDKEES